MTARHRTTAKSVFVFLLHFSARLMEGDWTTRRYPQLTREPAPADSAISTVSCPRGTPFQHIRTWLDKNYDTQDTFHYI